MGIVLRQSDNAFSVVSDYYSASKREPTAGGSVSVGSTDSFKPNFLDLLNMLVAKQQTDVVIVCHGGEDGLIMPITPTSSVSAQTAVLTDLRGLVDGTVPEEKFADFVTSNSCTEAELTALIAQTKKIRGHAAASLNLHFRGCKIGKKAENLSTIRKLLGSKLVSAPKCPMLYAPFSPNWRTPTFDVADWKTKNTPDTRRREFTVGGSTLVLDVNYGGSTGSTQGAITTIGDLPAFFTLVYGQAKHGKTRNGPIAAMWPDVDYALPHESTYTAQIETNT